MNAAILSFVTIVVVGIVILLVLQVLIILAIKRRVTIIQKKISELQSIFFTSEFSKDFETNERRIKFRASTNLQGKLVVNDSVVNIRIHNISKTGALLYSEDRSLHIGKVYPLTILLSDDRQVSAQAKIVRELADIHQYGISFQGLSIESLNQITDFLSKQARQELLEDAPL